MAYVKWKYALLYIHIVFIYFVIPNYIFDIYIKYIVWDHKINKLPSDISACYLQNYFGGFLLSCQNLEQESNLTIYSLLNFEMHTFLQQRFSGTKCNT